MQGLFVSFNFIFEAVLALLHSLLSKVHQLCQTFFLFLLLHPIDFLISLEDLPGQLKLFLLPDSLTFVELLRLLVELGFYLELCLPAFLGPFLLLFVALVDCVLVEGRPLVDLGSKFADL